MDAYVTFYIDQQMLGIDVNKVQEVIPTPTITSIPKSQKVLAGLFNLRGQIVTSIDLKEKLNRTPCLDYANTMSVIIESNGELFGLIVDSVGDVIETSEIKMENPPVNLDSTWRQCTLGVYQLKSELLLAVNLKFILNMNAQDFIKMRGN